MTKKSLKIVAQFIVDKDGNETPLDPNNIPVELANAAAAVIKTIETGQQWVVRGA
jgi:hypothetical protein